MAQHLRALTVLPEDPGSIPSTTLWFQLTITLPSGPHGYWACMWYKGIHAGKMHIKQNKYIKTVTI